MFGNKKVKEEQQKAIEIVTKLMAMPETTLEARFQKTHGKVALAYNDHKVEMIEDDHGVMFVVKYGCSKVSLNKKQYTKLMDQFKVELSRRSGERKDFSYLEGIIAKG